MLMDLLDIQCEIVYGQSGPDGQGHAWNRVKLDNDYYLLDATWDSQLTINDSLIAYDYFNLTDEWMNQDHTPLRSFPEKNAGTKYNYFVYNGLLYSNASEAADIVSRAFSAGQTSICLRGRDTSVPLIDVPALMNQLASVAATYGYTGQYYYRTNQNAILIYWG